MMTFGDLFAGIGGFSLGLERASMVCKWQVEINPFCQQVLAKHWPDVMRYADVRDCGKHNLAPVDLIAGGFPCQPHSVAGQQKGAEDDRDLWPEYRRIVAELRPDWVLAENVPGIRRTMLNEVLSDLEDLAYSTRTLVVPACAFDAPHKRERVFIVAYAEGTRLAQRFYKFKGGRQEIAQAWNPGLVSGPAGCYGAPYDWGRDWPAESILLRKLHGIPNRVDRVTALGNAVVPQVAEWIARRIVAADTAAAPRAGSGAGGDGATRCLTRDEEHGTI